MTQPPSYPPPAPAIDYSQGPKPDSYLVWAILTTLFCCLPFGIISIVYAAKVDGLWTAGDQGGARAASDNAKKWAIISAVAGAVLLALWFAFVGVGVMSQQRQF